MQPDIQGVQVGQLERAGGAVRAVRARWGRQGGEG